MSRAWRRSTRRSRGVPRVDLVFLDLFLPDAQGLEGLRWMRARYPELPVVVLTGASEGELAQRALREGAEDFLSKDTLKAGEIVRVIGYAVERHRRQRRAREVGERLRSVVDANLDALVVVDEAGDILLANPAAAGLLGSSVDALVGQRLPFELSGANPEEIEIYSAAQRSTRLLEVRTAVLNWDGLEAILASFRDVTVRRRVSELERRLDNVDRLVAMGELLEGIAHDIRGPVGELTALAENLQAALEGFARVPPGEQMLLLERCQSAVARSLELLEHTHHVVDDVRAFSRSEHTAALDLRELLRTSSNFVENTLRHSARLELDLSEVSPIRGARHALIRVFMNLLHNAALASEESAHPEPVVRVQLRGGPQWINVWVEDMGPGVPEELREKIFEPFFTTRGARQGTGLGLAQAVKTLGQHGGTISVSDRPGGGARF